MKISPARRIAFDILLRVETKGAYASDALHAALDDKIKYADAALATEITMGVLRWQGQLDFLLAQFSDRPFSRFDPEVAVALRIALYQLRFLTRIPASAAVTESVQMVKLARKVSAAPFVNAMLRKASLQARRPAADLLPTGMPAAERLAALYSHPLWMVQRWLARFGEERAAALLQANNRPPRLTCAVSDPQEKDAVLTSLRRESLHPEPGLLLNQAFSVSGGSPARSSAFREGRISIQDEASQAVPLLLNVKPGTRVLDLCAAPGGKTAALARAAGEDGLVVATDLHTHRLIATRAQFARLHLDRVHLIALDAEKPLPLRAFFDRVLVDAPCSGTGTLARHPEIRWRLKPEQLTDFHRLQLPILRRAAGQTKVGGRMLYSTCSLEPEENEKVVDEVVKKSSAYSDELRRVPAAEAIAALTPHLARGVDPARLFDANGAFRTAPERDGTDGFFAALLEKVK